MPLIITATDFSEVAENAVRYACALATAQKARLTIMHSFVIPVMFSDIPMPGSLVTDAQNDAEDKMKELVASMSASFPTVAIDGKVLYGSTVDALEDYIEEKNEEPWMIVVGNSSQAGSTWPDSILMDAFRKLAYPVLAVPPAYGYRPIKNICFAFDNRHAGNEQALRDITALTTAVCANLHVLNVQQSEENKQEIDVDAQRSLSSLKPEYHIVYSADKVDAAIHDFTGKNNIDWLILVPRTHSFFEGLFHKSHTKTVTHDAQVPIVAVHERQ